VLVGEDDRPMAGTQIPSTSPPIVRVVAPNVLTVEEMLIGYTDAVSRFEDAARLGNAVVARLAVCEALEWAVKLEDRVRAHWAPDGGDPLNWSWRTRLPNAEVMAGFRFVRNRVHHQWADALVLVDGGITFPITFPARFSEWHWRLADELPPEDPKHPAHPDEERAYRDLLEHRPVRHTLDLLGGVFFTVQRLLEPPSRYRPAA
jgi:hypothetical protein